MCVSLCVNASVHHRKGIRSYDVFFMIKKHQLGEFSIKNRYII